MKKVFLMSLFLLSCEECDTFVNSSAACGKMCADRGVLMYSYRSDICVCNQQPVQQPAITEQVP